MGTLIRFLIDNFIYVVFIAIILILALIGYIVDSSKSAKLKAEFEKGEKNEDELISLSSIDTNVTLGETVNKMAMNDTSNVNEEENNNPLNMG